MPYINAGFSKFFISFTSFATFLEKGSYWVPDWWSIRTILAVIPAEAGIHIKLIYKNIFNKTFLKNHLE